MYPVVSKRLLRVLANDGLIRMLQNKLASDTTFSAELHDTSRYQKNIYISNLGGSCERAEFCDTSDTSRYEKAYIYQTWVGGVNWSSFPIQLIRTDTKKHIRSQWHHILIRPRIAESWYSGYKPSIFWYNKSCIRRYARCSQWHHIFIRSRIAADGYGWYVLHTSWYEKLRIDRYACSSQWLHTYICTHTYIFRYRGYGCIIIWYKSHSYRPLHVAFTPRPVHM